MRPRGPLIPGPLGLLLVAVIVVPEVIKHCKPLAKSVGDFLVKAGEEINKMADKDAEPEVVPPPVHEAPAEEVIPVSGTDLDVDAPNEDVNRQPANETTKRGAGTKDIDLNTVSPTGHEEVESQIAAEAGAAPVKKSKSTALKTSKKETKLPKVQPPAKKSSAKPT